MLFQPSSAEMRLSRLWIGIACGLLLVLALSSLPTIWAMPAQNPLRQTVPCQSDADCPAAHLYCDGDKLMGEEWLCNNDDGTCQSSAAEVEDCAAKPGEWKAYTDGCPSGYECEAYYTYTCSGEGCVLKDTPEQKRKRCSANAAWVADPVDPGSGEFVLTETDLLIAGRGFNYEFTRSYSSQGEQQSPLGYNWDHTYNIYLTHPTTDTLLMANGPTGMIAYHDRGDGTYRSTLNYYSVITMNTDGTLTSRTPEGLTAHFFALDDSATAGKLARVVDRNDNTMHFDYDDEGRLTTVMDTLGRMIRYQYDAAGHLIAVADPLGRRVLFEYDSQGDLVSVTRAATTPGEKDRITKYTYTSGFVHARLNHNLLTVTHPNETAMEPDGPPAVINTYGTDPASYAFDRVIQQQVNSAGAGCCGFTGVGTVTLSYVLLDPNAGIGEMNTARTQTIVTDSLGHVTEYFYNAAGGLLRTVQKPALPSEAEALITHYTYNYNAEQTAIIYPDGSRTEYIYDEVSSNRLQQGNVLVEQHGPASGYEEAPLTITYTYEPNFNQMLGKTDPDGNVTAYAYDSWGNLTIITNALGYINTFTYDPGGVKTAETDANGHTTTFDEYYLAPPIPSFSVTPPTGFPFTVFTFDASTSWDIEDTSADLRIRWDWEDDGQYDTSYTTTKIMPHAYSTYGLYTVRLEVLDRDQLTATAISQVMVKPPYRVHLPVVARNYEPRTLSKLYLPLVLKSWQTPNLTSPSPFLSGFRLLLDQMVGTTVTPLPAIPSVEQRPSCTRATNRALWTTTRLSAMPSVSPTSGVGQAPPAILWSDVSTTSLTFRHIVTTTDPLGALMIQVYDAYGNLLSQTDANHHTTHYGYDAFNQRVVMTDALGNTTLYAYDLNGNLIRETDAYGNSTLYEYDIRGQLIVVTDTLGSVTRYAYDANGNKIAETDANGHTTTYEYDEFDRLIKITDPLGGTILYAYDANGNKIAEIDANGNTTAYVYDGFGRLIQVSDPLSHTTSYAYDTLGNTIVITDANGHTRHFEYDALGRRLREWDGLGNVTEYAYDSVGNVTRVTDPRGITTITEYDPLNRIVLIRQDDGGLNLETAYQYDAVGNLISTTNAQGIVTAYEYDALNRQVMQRVDAVPGGLNLTTTYTYNRLGFLTSVTDPNGHTTTYETDALGHVITTTDPLGNVTRYTYDKLGHRISVTNPNNQTTMYQYDALGRLVQLTNALGDKISYGYDSNGNRISTLDPNNHLTRYEYDKVNRLIREIDPLGHIKTYEYDNVGYLRQVRDPLGHVWTYQYDAAGRLITETNPLGQSNAYTYDAGGNRTTVTKAIPPAGAPQDGKTTVYVYDAANRLVQETNPLGHTTTYAYDKVGNRVVITDANGHATTFTYDAANRLISIISPLSNTTHYIYDPAGQVTATVRANGDVIHYGYDAAGRPTSVRYPDDTSILRTYDAAGYLRHISGPNTDISIDYDLIGRPLTVTDHLRDQSVSYTYDAVGKRLSLIGPNGAVTDYQYDANGRVTGVTQGTQVFNFAYDANGRLTTQTFPNNARVLYRYDDAGRTVGILYQQADGSVVDSLTYELDAAGNRTRLTFMGGDIVEYDYDAVDQLIAESRSGSFTYNQTFTYDAVGNRTRWMSDSLTTDYAYNAADQLVQQQGLETVNYTYDANGNLVARIIDGQTITYTYNYEGLLQTISGPGTHVINQYDAFDRRVAQVVNGVTTYFVYDDVRLGATVLAEYTDDDVLLASYILAPVTDGQLARLADGVIAYYLRDGLGSTRHMMNADGDWLNSYEYDGFGRLLTDIAPEANLYLFAGLRWDTASGLYYDRARYYAPDIGRFTQPDPLGPIEAINLYQYALNNPVNRIDPLGWASETCHSISYESEQNLGLLKWANQLSVFLRFLPNAPRVKWEGRWSVKGELCRKCCDSGVHSGQFRDVGTVNIQANASMEVGWPLAALRISIAKYTINIGLEAYAKFELSVSGGGKIDQCEGKTSLNVCGGGSITGGIRGGLLEWPFETVKVVVYVYGEISGRCQTCIEYASPGGLSLKDTKCSICGKAGYHIEVEVWRLKFVRDGVWWQAGGC